MSEVGSRLKPKVINAQYLVYKDIYIRMTQVVLHYAHTFACFTFRFNSDPTVDISV